MLASLLLLVGALGLDVRVEEARGLSDAERGALGEQVRARAAARGADGALIVRALAVPGALRVTLSRPDSARTAQAVLQGPPHQWGGAIDAALDALGWAAAPEPAPPAPDPATNVSSAVPAATPPPADDRVSVLGLGLLGGAIATGAVGVVLGVMNLSARDEGNPLPPGPDRDALDDRATATGLGANVLFGVAGAALVAGVVVLVLD